MTTPSTGTTPYLNLATDAYTVRVAASGDHVEFVYGTGDTQVAFGFGGLDAITDRGTEGLVNLHGQDGSLLDGPIFHSKQDQGFQDFKAAVLALPQGAEEWTRLRADDIVQDAPPPVAAAAAAAAAGIDTQAQPGNGGTAGPGTASGDGDASGGSSASGVGGTDGAQAADGTGDAPAKAAESGGLAAHLVAEVRTLVDWLAREEGNMQHEAYLKLQEILHPKTAA